MTSVTAEPPEAGRLAVRPPARRGLWTAGYVVVLLALLAIVGWVSTHPDPLPTSTTRVLASTPPGRPVFVGVFAPAGDADRHLHISGVHVSATATSDVTILPHVCHDGSINVTTTPERFCTPFGPTEDTALEEGDEIVLEVVGDTPGVVDIDRVQIAYRDGLQWATQDAGAPARVTILPR
jgi:hypothetical protein